MNRYLIVTFDPYDHISIKCYKFVDNVNAIHAFENYIKEKNIKQSLIIYSILYEIKTETFEIDVDDDRSVSVDQEAIYFYDYKDGFSEQDPGDEG